MKNRILNAIRYGWYAFKNPQALNADNFKMLADMLILILKVGEERLPRMTHIAFVHPETNTDHEIVSIWAGAGIGSEPTKRIRELLDENSKLKTIVADYIAKEKK